MLILKQMLSKQKYQSVKQRIQSEASFAVLSNQLVDSQ